MIDQNFGKFNLLSNREKEILEKLAQVPLPNQAENIPTQFGVNPSTPADQQFNQQVDNRAETISRWIQQYTAGDQGSADYAAMVYDLAMDGDTLPWLQKTFAILNDWSDQLSKGNIPKNMQEIRAQIESIRIMITENITELTNMINLAQEINTTGV